MKQRNPKLLPWLAKKAGIPLARAEALWVEALRHATSQASLIESPEYWQAAVDHLLAGIAAESLSLREAPFGWGALIRLPAKQWMHGLTTAEALFAVGLRTAQNLQHRQSC